MTDEQTTTPDTSRGEGIEKPKEDEETLSIVDEARAIRDEIKKAKEELKSENDRKEKIQSEELLGGTSGGNVEAKKISPEDAKKQGAKEFFKGTPLAEAIDKL